MPYVNRRAGGGSGALIVATRSDNSNPAVFSDFTALETYTATPSGITDSERINVSDQILAREVFAVGTLTGSNQVQTLTAAYIRLNDNWVAVATNLVGTPGAPGTPGTDVSVASLSDNTIPIKDPNAERLIDSPIEVDSTSNRLVSTMALEVPPGTIYIGANTAISAAIRALNARSDITGNTALILAQLYDDTNGFQRPFGYSGDEITQVELNQTPGTDNADSAQFVITASDDELVFRIDTPTNTPNTSVDVNLVIRTTSHTGSVAVNHQQTLTTDALGVASLSFREDFNPILVDQGTELYVTVSLDGMVGNQDGATFTPNATIYRIVVERKNLAFEDEAIDHPVTLRRDMPTSEDAESLANASLNDNSALWIVANNQLSNSNRADATIRALQSGFLDLSGNPIPIVDTQADSIQLRGGTIVRVFGANEFRVVNSPVFESDITNGMQPSTPQPRFTRFQFQTQETSVAPGTTISGLKTFLISIERPDLLTGHLTITQGSETLTENTLLPTVRSAGVPVNSVELTNAGDSVTFTVTATVASGGTISAHITVRAYQPHELAYWGIRDNNDFSTVALSELSRVDVTENSEFDVTGNFDSGDFIGVLLPETHDAREITTFNLPARDLFTRTENARSLGGVNYILYTLQNNGGIDGVAAYTVEV